MDKTDYIARSEPSTKISKRKSAPGGLLSQMNQDLDCSEPYLLNEPSAKEINDTSTMAETATKITKKKEKPKGNKVPMHQNNQFSNMLTGKIKADFTNTRYKVIKDVAEELGFRVIVQEDPKKKQARIEEEEKINS